MSIKYLFLLGLGASAVAHGASTELKAQLEALDQRFVVGDYRIHYTLAGDHAFPAGETDGDRRSRAEGMLNSLADQLRRADQFYSQELGLTPPLRSERYSGVATIDFHILKLDERNGAAGDDPKGHSYQHFGASERALNISLNNRWIPTGLTPSHEIFHLYQYGYTYFKNGWYLEGMARSLESPFRDRQYKTEPLPATAEELNDLLERRHDAGPFWSRLFYQCNPSCQVSWKGTRYRSEAAMCSPGLVKALLDEYHLLDREAAKARGFNPERWPESEQKSLDNNPWLLAGLDRAIDKQCAPSAPDSELGKFRRLIRDKLPAPSPVVQGRTEPALAEGVQWLGDPYAEIYGDRRYAKNIWEMVFFKGRLYLGAGNSSNQPPAANAGPVPLIAYDPRERRFARQAVLDEEQIDRIVRVGGTLCIPGHDPTQSGALGNLYCRQDDGRWKKKRTIPGVLHAYDLAEHSGALYAALGIEGSGGGGVGRSRDGGDSWEVVPAGRYRAYSLLRLDGTLYPTRVFLAAGRNRQSRTPAVSELVGDLDFAPRPDLEADVLFPDTPLDSKRSQKIIKPVFPGGLALYIGAYIHNDHQSEPFGLYVATSLRTGSVDVRRIPLPEGFVAWNLLVHEGETYVLANARRSSGYETAVFALSDPRRQKPRRILAFETAALARSFATDGNGWYFGLGCENFQGEPEEALSPQCGHLLKVQAPLGSGPLAPG
ncbi:MAG: hypothetical protein H6R10_422 [Rhodocyclaceae bacterium]|nr:hypothetical protein [Rhodocyclaceae bacterium]